MFSNSATGYIEIEDLEFSKRVWEKGLLSFRNVFNTYNNTGALILDSI